MASLVLTENGITLQSFQELRADLQQSWIDTFGNAIDLSPSSPDGLHIDLECKTITSISQAIQAIASNLDRNTATGFWLEILASYMNITRKGASYSTINPTFSGTSGTVIPLGTTISCAGVTSNYETTEEATVGIDGTVLIPCQALTIGSISAPSGTWTMVSSTPSGITVLALTSGSVGLDIETDSELRLRMNNYSGSGLATYNTMLSYMENMEGVSSVTLDLNDEDVTDDAGLPAHRFQFFITGTATNTEIANGIWHCKPAGIKPFGSESGIATDAAGKPHIMYWDIPTTSPLWVKITLSQYSEESLPEDWEGQIRANIVSWAETEFTSGKDVIPKRFYGTIYSTAGILDVTVEVAIGINEPTSWSSGNISISAGVYAELVSSRVLITMDA
jgi:uncharacterized phage protein gp47/JayE